MRLTLRTMLAYMDDILEPADNEDIRKRIDESKFATDLAQRIRDCLRRLRLPARPLGGRGLGADANSVSEYLDNTLSAERVADFEKICLESNAHLAEVAACHQILTLVLGEPADVDPALRERMYGLIDHAEADSKAESAAATAPPVASGATPPVGAGAQIPAVAASAASRPSRRAKPEVPEYLREKRSRLWPIAAIGVCAFLLTMGFLAVAMPIEWRETAARWFQGAGQSNPGAEPPPGATPAGDDGAASSTNAGDSANNNDSKETGEPKDTGEPKAAPPSDEPQISADSAGDKPPAATMPAETVIDQPATPTPATPVPPSGVDAPKASASEVTGAAMPAAPPGEGMPAAPGTGAAPNGSFEPLLATTPEPGNPAAAGGGNRPTATDMAAVVPPAPNAALAPAPKAAKAPPPGAIDVGRYTSDQDVLLQFDPDDSGWRRLAPKSAIVVGERIMSLPAFRSTIALVNGISMQAAGPSDFQFLEIDRQGVATISIEYGRLIFFTIGKADNPVRLEFGDRTGVATLVEGAAALAIEVARELPFGQDPEKEPAVLSVKVYAVGGSVRWEEDGAAIMVAAPAGRSLAPPPGRQLAGADAPKWIAGEPLSTSDQMAAQALDREIPFDQSASLRLKELSEHRRSEIRQLATRASGYLGLFEPFVHALSDDLQKSEWSTQIETLRAVLTRGPETAAQVREVFERHRGAEADHLYRMLWGYSVNQLKEGAAAQLVEDLNSESLDTRVLSFWNLRELTGVTLYYRPEYSAARRHPFYLNFKRRLKEGELIGKAVEEAAKRAHPGGRAEAVKP